MNSPVTQLLGLWPDRKAVHEDARAADPDLDLIAVHRWHSRQSVPAKYWQALIDGGKARGLKVSAERFVNAHAVTSSPSSTAPRSEAS